IRACRNCAGNMRRKQFLARGKDSVPGNGIGCGKKGGRKGGKNYSVFLAIQIKIHNVFNVLE
ncbi:MAG: hypothetical protein ABWY05_12190, partial [Noviherbaspirillum sp.]